MDIREALNKTPQKLDRSGNPDNINQVKSPRLPHMEFSANGTLIKGGLGKLARQNHTCVLVIVNTKKRTVKVAGAVLTWEDGQVVAIVGDSDPNTFKTRTLYLHNLLSSGEDADEMYAMAESCAVFVVDCTPDTMENVYTQLRAQYQS